MARCSVIGSTTASQVKTEEVTKSTVDLDLHCHWLALELYNQFNTNIENNEKIVVKIDNFTDTIQPSSLSRMVRKFQKIAKSHKSRASEVQWEQILTAQIAREFDRYLFTDDDKAGFYHQLPYYSNLQRGGPQKGDGMVVPHVDDIVDFKKSVLVYDFKPSDLGAAKTESIAYISRMLSFHTKSTFPVYLALFPTCFEISFTFVLNLPDHMGFAEICRVTVDDDTNMKKLFVSLHAGINYLVHHPISYTDVAVIEPKMDLQFTVLESLWWRKRESYKIFHHEGYVYKLFDTHSCMKSNRKVLDMVDYFEDLSLENLSNDGRFQCLRYKFIHGDDIQKYTREMFLSVAETLKILHSNGLVHSDVRLSNMVFDSGKNIGYLIDFDLTDKVGSLYPEGYNSIKERHGGARANKGRKFEHDTFSLCVVISRLLNITINDTENLEEVIQVLSEK